METINNFFSNLEKAFKKALSNVTGKNADQTEIVKSLNETIKEERTKIETEFKTVSEQLETAKSDLATANQEKTDLQTEFDTFKSENEATATKNTELEGEVSTLKTEVENLTAKNEELEAANLKLSNDSKPDEDLDLDENKNEVKPEQKILSPQEQVKAVDDLLASLEEEEKEEK